MRLKAGTAWKLVLAIIVIIFALIFAWNIVKSIIIKNINFTAGKVITISATSAKQQNWTPEIQAVGSLKAINGIDISPEISGLIESIHFEPGQDVKQGDKLFILSSRSELAERDKNLAQVKLLKIEYDRQVRLLKTNSTSQSNLDKAEASLKQAEAALAQSQSQLDKTIITAPYDGRIGIRQVSIGQYITPGTHLVSLQSINPIYVNFTIPEQQLKDIYAGQPTRISVDTYPKETFNGKISAINSQVDNSSRNILVQAKIENPDEKLLPGMFANISIDLPTQKNVLVVPKTAIAYSLYGDSVFVVYDKKQGDKTILTTKREFVKVGASRDKVTVINKGLTPGDCVVTSGQLKVQPGIPIQIKGEGPGKPGNQGCPNLVNADQQ